ncbi:MAG: hypothetical protein K2M12_07430 [Muribaculaceae bacterium]|nr:hypothetical protein [Muribaculaceae bacterium]
MILILLTAAVIILLGLAAVIQNKTLIEWWIPVSACAAVALPLALVLKGMMRRLTGLDKAIWNVVAGFVLSFAAAAGGFYSLNYFRSNAASAQEYSAAVVNKYSEKHYRTKRVSRKYSTRGEAYLVYYVVVELPGDKRRRIEVSPKDYVKTKVGGRLHLQIEDGLFGVPVIKNLSFPVRQRIPRRR